MAKKNEPSALSNVACMIMRIMAVATAVMAVILVVSAYGGHIDPRTTAKAAIVTLALPYLTGAMIAVAFAWLLLRQFKFALIAVASIVICSPSILEVFPLNTRSHKLTPEEEDNAFTVLSYNAYYFAYTHNSPNEQIQLEPMRHLLTTNADLACVQEGPIAYGSAGEKDARARLIRKIRSCYPYHYVSSNNGLAIYSKNRISVIKSGDFDESSCYVLAKTIIKGRELNVLNVHLESIGLNAEDKELFMQYTRPRNFKKNLRDFKQAKTSIGGKLMRAFEKRAAQADSLRAIINSLEGNLILCGDFNDTPRSYAYNTVSGNDMTEAYAACGFGPTITYHVSRFWLKIDHIFSRGNLKPVAISRSNEKVSDHYSLLATYVWEKNLQDNNNEKK